MTSNGNDPAHPDGPSLPEGVSQNEHIKARSNHLRGTVREELAEDTPAFGEENVQVLKFHGIYQQDDRDRRKEARRQGLGKYHMLMVRTRVPGGIVSADGYLAHDRVAGDWGNGTLRVTTRQDFQLHGVLKTHVRQAIQAINANLLTTLGGCGDQERNIMCCPAPVPDDLHGESLRAVAALVDALGAKTGAYVEIWLDGEPVTSTQPPEEEPLYGETYLPRKFKTAVALEDDNCVDVYANDLGLIAIRSRDGDRGGLAGFDLLAGGGLGRTHRKPDTYPAIGLPLAFVTPEQAVAASRAVVEVQRDHGNRTDRRYARLKYLLADRGLDWFRQQVQQRLDFELQPFRELPRAPVYDHLGWHEQGDGNLFCGVYVENGRIADTDQARVRTGLRTIVDELRPQVRLTPQQNVILAGIDPRDRSRVDQLLEDHGITPADRLRPTIRNAMACPALPTCGLAVAESERVLPDLIRRLDAVVDELGLGDEQISYRMTGCPNGCARPYLGDVGFVGTTVGKYDVLLGGDFEGTRLNQVYASNVTLDEIPDLLRGPLTIFKEERRPGQAFGDWCHEVGVEALSERFGATATAEAVTE